MATQAALRQRVLDNLYSNEPQARPTLQRLNGSVASTSADTTVTVDDGSGIVVGDVIEFDDGEQGLVWAVATNDLTVVRDDGNSKGWNGTTNAAHDDNEFVKINPIHTIKQVDEALNEALRDMEAQKVWQIAAGTDITLVAGTDLYELTETDFVLPPGVLSVFYQEASNGDLVGLPFLLESDPQSQALTADLGIRLLNWGNNAAGDALEVVYAQSVVSAGLGNITEPLLEDAAVLYATGKLQMARDGARLHDPGRYTDRTVQPGQGIRQGSLYMAQYQRTLWKAKAEIRLNARDLPGEQWRRARHFRR